MRIDNQKLVDIALTLNDPDHNVLGPNLYIESCQLYSHASTSSLVIAGVTMTDCTFEQIEPLLNFHFENAHLINTSFIGTYDGCDFGDWDSNKRSSIKDCDFTEAKVNNSRFINCDMASIKLPSWPIFSIINPCNAHEYVIGQDWPGDLGIDLDVITDMPAECSAIIMNAEKLASDNELSITDIYYILSNIPGFKTSL
ncbi:pentapeptide repeat-containing protein [Gallaecimonas pentaromativorans]|uniref:Pentapeptide repeat protein n=1 Tax=Gallaecimonas pentaromativorans TaxID=584787 RepID=A0A3N1PJN7_9GAMM|nr:hypothetical protein [Gallaecimonas pentaromativorans]ROQ28855.1 hypothetical protein EDC28_103452 [Gallaecimonas pentaromativorans]